ncbi:MAG: protein translocase subunit SecD [Bacteriovoracaceae bacterium]
MAKGWLWRVSVLMLLVLLALGSVVPSFTGIKDESWYPFKKKVNLGLDLQGGLYMVLGIDFDKVYRDEVLSYTKKTQSTLAEQGIEATLGDIITTDPKDPQVKIDFADASKIEAAKSKINELYSYPLRLVADDKSSLTYGIGREFKKEIEETAISKSIEVIRNRIDEFGVTEPEIVSQGQDRIVVQLPGVKDIERAKDLIGKTAKLEFKFVNDTISPVQTGEWMEKVKTAGIEYKKGERFSDYVKEVNEFLKNDLPKAHEISFSKTMNNKNEITNLEPYILESVTSLTGDELQEAFVTIDRENNRPEVAINFKPSGAKIFEEVTGNNIGRRLAIVLDGNVYSAPVLQSRIAGGSARITLGVGDYNTVMTEARDLALVLRAGALPVELVFEEQRVVGPSLGADAIAKAETASVVASLLVFIFVIILYKMSGVLASVTLIINVLFSLACLIALDATLTLPGIAGIALTVGMAVDGNIIIYERIREELRSGASAKEAVATGFDKAFWTILDANLTTAVAGLCLLNFGTGPVRGFAVTLLIGIAATIYTSYFVSKILMELYLGSGEQKKNLSI